MNMAKKSICLFQETTEESVPLKYRPNKEGKWKIASNSWLNRENYHGCDERESKEWKSHIRLRKCPIKLPVQQCQGTKEVYIFINWEHMSYQRQLIAQLGRNTWSNKNETIINNFYEKYNHVYYMAQFN